LNSQPGASDLLGSAKLPLNSQPGASDILGIVKGTIFPLAVRLRRIFSCRNRSSVPRKELELADEDNKLYFED